MDCQNLQNLLRDLGSRALSLEQSEHCQRCLDCQRALVAERELDALLEQGLPALAPKPAAQNRILETLKLGQAGAEDSPQSLLGELEAELGVELTVAFPPALPKDKAAAARCLAAITRDAAQDAPRTVQTLSPRAAQKRRLPQTNTSWWHSTWLRAAAAVVLASTLALTLWPRSRPDVVADNKAKGKVQVDIKKKLKQDKPDLVRIPNDPTQQRPKDTTDSGSKTHNSKTGDSKSLKNSPINQPSPQDSPKDRRPGLQDDAKGPQQKLDEPANGGPEAQDPPQAIDPDLQLAQKLGVKPEDLELIRNLDMLKDDILKDLELLQKAKGAGGTGATASAQTDENIELFMSMDILMTLSSEELEAK